MVYLRPYKDDKEDRAILNLLSCIRLYPGYSGIDGWRTTLFNDNKLYAGVKNYVYLHRKESYNVWTLNILGPPEQIKLRLRFYNCTDNCTLRLHVIVTFEDDANYVDNLFLSTSIRAFIQGLVLKFLDGQTVTTVFVKEMLGYNLYSSSFIKGVKQFCDEL
jgi:hypothetical protein